jgi:hypothetical protein
MIQRIALAGMLFRQGGWVISVSLLHRKSRHRIALAGAFFVVAALAPIGMAQAGGVSDNSRAPDASGSGTGRLMGVGAPKNGAGLQGRAYHTPFLPVGVDRAEYRAAKSGAAISLAPARASIEPRHAPPVQGGLTNVNGANFANSAGTGVPCNCAPPDVDVAAGNSQVVEVVNLAMEVYTKGTSTTAPALQLRTGLRSFFGIASTTRITDPRVVYDDVWDRWVITLTRVASSSTDTVHQFYVAVSTTSSATGSFFKYTMNWALGFGTTAGDWMDFPGLGFDQDAIAMTGVFFDTPAGGYKTSGVIGMAKARLYNGLGISFPIKGFSTGVIQPNIVLDQNARMFLLVANTASDRIDVVTCAEMEKPGAMACSIKAGPGVGFNLAPPPSAVQPGSAVPIDTLDGRFENRGYQVGSSVWQAHTISAAGLPTPNFYQYNSSTNGLTQQGCPGGTCGWFNSSIANSRDYNASIAANALGEAFVTWNSSSTTVRIQARFSGRHVGDALNSMNSPGSLMFQSTATYTLATTGEPPRRWGDYSGSALDPQNYGSGAQRRAWVAIEKVETNGTWGSRFVRIGYV